MSKDIDFVNDNETAQEDMEFLKKVNQLLNFFVEKEELNDVCVFKVKNWFDYKWLNFSGIGVVDFYANMPNYYREAALDEHWKEKITLPPFTPNRILKQQYFSRVSENRELFEHYKIKPIHIWQFSNKNLNKRILDYTNSGIFLWYSSNSLVNGKASIMIYTMLNSVVTSFFVSFSKKDTWFIEKVKGTDRNLLPF